MLPALFLLVQCIQISKMENLLEEEANQGGEKKRGKKKEREKKRENLHPLGGVIVAKRARRNLVDRSPRCLPSWQCSSSVHYSMAFTEHRSIIYYYSSDPEVQRWNWTCRRSKTRSSKQTRYSHDWSRHLCGAMQQRQNARNTWNGETKKKKVWHTRARPQQGCPFRLLAIASGTREHKERWEQRPSLESGSSNILLNDELGFSMWPIKIKMSIIS